MSASHKIPDIRTDQICSVLGHTVSLAILGLIGDGDVDRYIARSVFLQQFLASDPEPERMAGLLLVLAEQLDPGADRRPRQNEGLLQKLDKPMHAAIASLKNHRLPVDETGTHVAIETSALDAVLGLCGFLLVQQQEGRL